MVASKLKSQIGDTKWYKHVKSLGPMPTAAPKNNQVDKISLVGMKSDAALRSNISLGSPVKGTNDSDTSINMPSISSNSGHKRHSLDYEDPDDAKYQRRQNPLLTGSGTVPSLIRSIMYVLYKRLIIF